MLYMGHVVHGDAVQHVCTSVHTCLYACILAKPMRGGGGPFSLDFSSLVCGRILMVEYQGAEPASIDTPRVDASRVWVDFDFDLAAGVVAKDQMRWPTP